MSKFNVKFNFDVDFECDKVELENAVIDWWLYSIVVPDYTITEIKE
jgi:hypothetical protein